MASRETGEGRKEAGSHIQLKRQGVTFNTQIEHDKTLNPKPQSHKLSVTPCIAIMHRHMRVMLVCWHGAWTYKPEKMPIENNVGANLSAAHTCLCLIP